MTGCVVVPGGRLFDAFRTAAIACLRAARACERCGDYDGAAELATRAAADARIAGLPHVVEACERAVERAARLEAERFTAERERSAEYDEWTRGASVGVGLW